jgi:hypothetical protein
MKYLITICLTALVIAFLHESGKSFQEQIRAEARMRALMFKSYAEHRHGDPRVEVPTEKDLKKEKL